MFKVKEGLELFGDAKLRHPTGNYGSVEIDGGANSSWEGYSIGGRSVFMHNNGSETGLYNDVNNEWLFKAIHNGASYMYNNGTSQLEAQGGYGLAPNQMRSPIYYDSNDTAYYVDPNGTSRIYNLDVMNKRMDIGSSANWDEVGFSKQTNLHFQGHNQFWVGAGNATWFAGSANTKNQATGLAADVGSGHDLLLTTMQAVSNCDRGITFGVDTTGAGTVGYRLGKWHSGSNRANSMLAVDGQLVAKGGATDFYDYYANDYSKYWSQGIGSWGGDGGWHKPSIVAANAIQIQAGNGSTSSNKPQIQFHQYGYGGPIIEYSGPDKRIEIRETGSTDRFTYLNVVGQVRGDIYYDRNNTAYYLDPASSGTSMKVRGGIILEQGNTCSRGIELNSVKDSTWPFEFTSNDVGNDNPSGFWVGSNGYPDMRLRRDNGTVRAKISSWERSHTTYGFTDSTDIRSPIFYDNNDTSYWVNPADANFSTKFAGTVHANAGLGTEGGSIRITNPGGASYATTSSSRTGAIKITLPNRSTNTMLSFEVKVYEYQSMESFTVQVSGYNYSSGWINTSAHIIGQPGKDRNFTVRFSDDGSKRCILIGDTNSTWSYPQVAVTNFHAGYSGFNIDQWNNGWSVGFTTSYGTVSSTITNTQVGRLSNIWYDRDNTGYYVDPASTTRLNHVSVIGTLTETSDARLKSDIKPIENALEKVEALSGYTYFMQGTEARKTGVIAQEVEQVLPEAVTGDTTKSVAYGNMVGLLIEAIKEQQTQINTLTSEIKSLKGNA